MTIIRVRSSAGLLSALAFGAILSFAGCGDDGGGGGGTGGKTSDAAVGTGGKATGGSGGGGTIADAASDKPMGTGGAGGAGGATGMGGTTSKDAADDRPMGTGGAGGSKDGGGALDTSPDGGGTSPLDGGPATMLHLYVGCADSTGTVQSYSLNSATAALAPLGTFVAGGAISNCELNDAEDRLYVEHVISNEGRITTYFRNPTSGLLTATGTPAVVPFSPPGAGGVDGGIDGGSTSTNAGPQTLTFDRGRRFVAVPNYFSHNVYVYQMSKDGTVGPMVSSHAGGNNAHHAVFTLNNEFMLVPYLGSNLIQVYAFDSTTGDITAKSSTALPAAQSGPRHIALHANGKWLYSINETAGGTSSTAGTIDQFSVDEKTGVVASTATFNVPLPAGYTGAKNGGEIEIAPSGNMLFVSMRLDNAAQGTLVSYSINATTGALTLIEQESSRGITPRHFSLSKDGRLMVVGNQNSDTIAVFRVDPATGEMTFASQRDVCDSPRFARVALVK